MNSPISAPSAPPRENSGSVLSTQSSVLNSAPFHQKLPRPSLNRALVSPQSTQSSVLSPQSSRESQFEFHIVKPTPLLTVSDLADEWDYSETHIIGLIEAGELFAFTTNREEPAKQKHPHYRIVRESAVHGTRLTLAGMTHLLDTVDAWLLPVERFGRRQTFTIDLCAAALAICPRSARNLCDAGQLRHRDCGLGVKELSRRIPRTELVAFVQRRLRQNNNIL